MQYLSMKVRSSWLPTTSSSPSQIRWEWLLLQSLVIITTLAYFTFIYLPILPIWKIILQKVVSSTLFISVSLAIIAHARGINCWFEIPLILWTVSTSILVGFSTQSLALSLPIFKPFWALVPSIVILLVTYFLNRKYHFLPRIMWQDLLTLSNLFYLLAGLTMGGLLALHLRFTAAFIPGLGRTVQFPFSVSDALTIVLIGFAAVGEELFFRQVVFTFLVDKRRFPFSRLQVQVTAMVFLLSMADALQTSMILAGIFIVMYRAALSLLNTTLRYRFRNLGVCIATNLTFSILFWVIRG